MSAVTRRRPSTPSAATARPGRPATTSPCMWTGPTARASRAVPPGVPVKTRSPRSSGWNRSLSRAGRHRHILPRGRAEENTQLNTLVTSSLGATRLKSRQVWMPERPGPGCPASTCLTSCRVCAPLCLLEEWTEVDAVEQPPQEGLHHEAWHERHGGRRVDGEGGVAGIDRVDGPR